MKAKPVTTAAGKVCLGDSLQSWWNNELRPDLWLWISFPPCHKCDVTTMLSLLYLGCAACQRPSSQASEPRSSAYSSQSTPTVRWTTITAGLLDLPTGASHRQPWCPRLSLQLHIHSAGPIGLAHFQGVRDKPQVCFYMGDYCCPWHLLNRKKALIDLTFHFLKRLWLNILWFSPKTSKENIMCHCFPALSVESIFN